jgi:hypothetical protein
LSPRTAMRSENRGRIQGWGSASAIWLSRFTAIRLRRSSSWPGLLRPYPATTWCSICAKSRSELSGEVVYSHQCCRLAALHQGYVSQLGVGGQDAIRARANRGDLTAQRDRAARTALYPHSPQQWVHVGSTAQCDFCGPIPGRIGIGAAFGAIIAHSPVTDRVSLGTPLDAVPLSS